MFALRRVSRMAIASVALVTLLALAGAALGGQAGPPPAEAVAMLVDTGGNTVGRVAFATTAGGKTEVRVRASGLTPGFHGFHVHTVGDCSAADFTSAGGHYNPAGTSHPNHAGDMPVLLVNADGKGSARIRTDRFAVDEHVLASGGVVPFGNHTVTLTLTGLPTHSLVELSVEFYTLRSWDGNRTDFGPDRWDLDATGTSSDIQPLATFSNYVGDTQSYPDGGSNPGTTGNAATGNLLRLGSSGNSEIPAVRYDLSYSFTHTTSDIKFSFIGSNLQGWGDEGWVLDDVVVSVVSASQTTVYSNDFSASIGSEWSSNAGILATPSGGELFDADGSAVIVHANPDNYANIPTDRYDPDPDTTTLATGDAGSRVACGVVERPA